jgi:hypothetical protein
MRYLIDPDPPQPVEQIDFALRLVADALADRADRPHATRISCATADFDVLTASHAA